MYVLHHRSSAQRDTGEDAASHGTEDVVVHFSNPRGGCRQTMFFRAMAPGKSVADAPSPRASERNAALWRGDQSRRLRNCSRSAGPARESGGDMGRKPVKGVNFHDSPMGNATSDDKRGALDAGAWSADTRSLAQCECRPWTTSATAVSRCPLERRLGKHRSAATATCAKTTNPATPCQRRRHAIAAILRLDRSFVIVMEVYGGPGHRP